MYNKIIYNFVQPLGSKNYTIFRLFLIIALLSVFDKSFHAFQKKPFERRILE